MAKKNKVTVVEDNINESQVYNDMYNEEDYIDPFEEMKSTIDEKNNEIKKLKNNYLYLQADFDNFKRNAAKANDNLSKYGSEKVIKDILPIIDDFERAFKHLTDVNSIEGMTLIYNKFITVLNNHNVSVINPQEGERFTDTMHEAISVVPSQDEESKGTIAQCIEKGYMLSDKVIRYAKVVVFN